MKIQVGNPRAAAALVAGLAAIFIGLAAEAIVAAAGSRVPGFFRVFFLVLAVLVLVAMAWFGFILLRNPRIINRTILVDAQTLVMPARRFGAIPTVDVAGVGLVRLRNPRNGAPAGSWAVAVWRSDGSIAYAGGLQRRPQVVDPATSRAAEAARQLHDAVVRLQGANGLLARSEMQRHASFTPYEQFTATWDPVQRGAA